MDTQLQPEKVQIYSHITATEYGCLLLRLSRALTGRQNKFTNTLLLTPGNYI